MPSKRARERADADADADDAAGDDIDDIDDADDDDLDAPYIAAASSSAPEPKKNTALDAAALERARKDFARRGVVYLGNLPPFMKPMKLRQLLNAYGATDRMYLTPEDAKIRAKRKKFGGNTGKKFVEVGWSFAIKSTPSDAQKCCTDERLVASVGRRIIMICGTYGICQSLSGTT